MMRCANVHRERACAPMRDDALRGHARASMRINAHLSLARAPRCAPTLISRSLARLPCAPTLIARAHSIRARIRAARKIVGAPLLHVARCNA
jgi:hypothetical protein